jgi:hypothetical protein
VVKVKTSYSDLRTIFNELGVVFKSKNIQEVDKNIIFDLSGDEVVLYAFALGVSARRVVDKDVFEVIQDGLYNPEHFQVPLVRLDNFLNVFSSGRGKPLDIEIEVAAEHELTVTLTEELEVGGVKEVNSSVAVFDTFPVKQKILSNLDVLNLVDTLEVGAVTDNQRKNIVAMVGNLLPYLPEKLDKDVALSFYGDYTLCNSASLIVRYTNKFAGLLDNGGLNVHALNVIEGIMKLGDDITFVRDEGTRTLVFKTSKLLMSVVYAVDPVVYKKDFFSMIEDNNYIVVSRADLGEVITRMSVFEKNLADGRVVISTDVDSKVSTFSTDSYAQPIKLVDLNTNPVGTLVNGIGGLNMNVNLAYLQNTMLGKVSTFDNNIRFTVQADEVRTDTYFFRADDSTGEWAIIMMIQ